MCESPLMSQDSADKRQSQYLHQVAPSEKPALLPYSYHCNHAWFRIQSSVYGANKNGGGYSGGHDIIIAAKGTSSRFVIP